MTIDYKANVNLEEDIKLKLSELLSFSPESFSFNYKKQGEKTIVNYKTDEAISRQELLQKIEKAKKRKILWFLGVLGILTLVNFVILKLKEDSVIKDSITRQKINNKQFHENKELSIAREKKVSNQKLIDEIFSFFQQPLQIERFYISDKGVHLEGFILKQDIDSFRYTLQEKNLWQMSYFADMGDKLWVLIKNY